MISIFQGAKGNLSLFAIREMKPQQENRTNDLNRMQKI